MNNDRNFDDLAPRFQRNIYGGLKGRIRLAILERDFREFLPQVLQLAGDKPLRILDAGGGRGPFSLPLAECGHHVTLCDLSAEMLKLAETEIVEKKLQDHVHLIHGAIQDLPLTLEPYDLVLCHAVVEWVHEPQQLIRHLLCLLKPQGFLSLSFYNKNGTIFKNLLRANYSKILKQDYSGAQGSLTPMFPRMPEDVLLWLQQEPLDILCRSGMRVFHDYILDKKNSEIEPDTVIRLELELSRQQPYRDLGRYQHILAQKHP
jgi:S-adenosylmethionine-dependent methyltransferase